MLADLAMTRGHPVVASGLASNPDSPSGSIGSTM